MPNSDRRIKNYALVVIHQDFFSVAIERNIDRMKTYAESEAVPGFSEGLMLAVSKLRKRVLQQYEQIYPDLGEIIRYVIEEEEGNAWSLSPLFPHLVLPDLVEAHIRQLGLQLTFIEPDKMAASPRRSDRARWAREPEQAYTPLLAEAVPTY
jgi:hypothetical protein